MENGGGGAHSSDEETAMETGDDGDEEEVDAHDAPSEVVHERTAATATAGSPALRAKRKDDAQEHTAASPAKAAKSSSDKPRSGPQDGAGSVAPAPSLHKSTSSGSQKAAAATAKVISKVNRVFVLRYLCAAL